MAERSRSHAQNKRIMKGWMYILLCNDGSYYTGSTIDRDSRLQQHQHGLGANHTRKRLPVYLIYLEEFDRIDKAFYREKQVQGWNRAKKEALIGQDVEALERLAKCKNKSSHLGFRLTSAPLSQRSYLNYNDQISLAKDKKSGN